jgi:Domain of unknown function (DUF6249)
MIRNLKLILTASAAFAPWPALAQTRINPVYDPAAMAAVEGFTQQSIVGMAGIVVVIVAALVFATLRDRRKLELLARFAEKGQEIPPALLPQPPSAEREMRRGVWIFSAGIGLGLALYIFTTDWAIAAWSLIPICLGVASFVNAALFYSKTESDGQA